MKKRPDDFRKNRSLRRHEPQFPPYRYWPIFRNHVERNDTSTGDIGSHHPLSFLDHALATTTKSSCKTAVRTYRKMP